MLKIWGIFMDDVKSIYKNLFVCIIIIFLMLIPSIYAWFNILASWDPYANTEGILVGVSNKDKGAELNGHSLNIGEEVIRGLKGNSDLGWRFTTEDEAVSKVNKGDYYASIIIPENFSERIATIMTEDPTKAEIDYYVNEKINSIAPKMTAAGANAIVDNVSKSFVKTASGSILSVFNELGITLQNELPTIQKMKNMVYFLEGQLPELEQNFNTVQNHMTHAEDIILKVHEGLKAVENITTQKDQLVSDVSIYSDSVHQAFNAINPSLNENLILVKSDNESLIGIADRLKNHELSSNEENQLLDQGRSRVEKEMYVLESMHNLLVRVNQFNEQNLLLPEIESINELRENTSKQLQALNAQSFDTLIDYGESNNSILTELQRDYPDNTGVKLGKLANEAYALLEKVKLSLQEGGQALPEVKALLEESNQTLLTRFEDISNLQDKFPEVENKIRNLANKLREIDKSYNMQEVISFLRNDMEKESEFFSEPVLLKQHTLFPIPNYGSAMSPFFTALSLWVGGTVLISILSVDVSQKVHSPYQIYIGRYLIFLIIGCMQALIVSIGNILLLDVYVADKWEYILFSVLISSVFTLLVYTFVSVLGNVGKGISVILMVLQISSSGGTFPVQVTPPFFQHINPFLPFTYAVSLLRESVGGITWSTATKDILILFLFIVITLFLGVILKKPFHRRTQKMKDKLYGSRLF
ncbi:YhgE/Pip family protein [Peribacillus sp. NPDC097295]|uniref:YhgE/Pip family protein n=1 Tax=Peribacillus sp. NPDC097295 TaxID=3364402 RepID=UPI00382F595A